MLETFGTGSTRGARRLALLIGLMVALLGFEASVAAAAAKHPAAARAATPTAPSWTIMGAGSGTNLGAATGISCSGMTCYGVGRYLSLYEQTTKSSSLMAVGPAALVLNAIACAPGFCAETGQRLGKRFDGSPFRYITVEANGVNSFLDTVGPTFKLGPLEPYANPSLAAVSCVKGRDCLAVGVQARLTVLSCSASQKFYNDQPECWISVPLAVVRSGGHWRQIPRIPLPVTPLAMVIGAGTGPWASLTGVSCSAASDCVVVGNFGQTTGASAPFAEIWNGSAFTEQAMAAVPGASRATVKSVSCAISGSCLAVGVATVNGTSEPFAEQLSGGAWSLVPVVEPTGVQSSRLTSVSCVRSGWCVASGSETLRSGAVAPLVEIWSGTAFTRSTLTASHAYPKSRGGAALAGVSCTATNHCVAIGNDYKASGALIGWFLSSYGTN